MKKKDESLPLMIIGFGIIIIGYYYKEIFSFLGFTLTEIYKFLIIFSGILLMVYDLYLRRPKNEFEKFFESCEIDGVSKLKKKILNMDMIFF